MWSYLLKRLGLSAVIVLSALLVLFLLLHLIPGDPARIALGTRASPEAIARYAAKAHLDEPVLVQFWIYFTNALSGDLGVDVFSERSVARIVLEDLPSTLILAAAALFWSALIGIPLGCLSAIRPNSWFDRMTGIISVSTIAIPSLLVAIWSLVVFGLLL